MRCRTVAVAMSMESSSPGLILVRGNKSASFHKAEGILDVEKALGSFS